MIINYLFYLIYHSLLYVFDFYLYGINLKYTCLINQSIFMLEAVFPRQIFYKPDRKI